MKLRAAILIPLIFACLLLVHNSFKASEPDYKGKSLSVWLKNFDGPPTNPVARLAAQEAVVAIGTNALPYLMTLIEAKDGKIKRTVLQFNENHPWSKLGLTSALTYHERAWAGFDILGPKAQSIVPSLIKDLDYPNMSVRLYAAEALGRIGPAASNALPALTLRLKDSDPFFQWEFKKVIDHISHADTEVRQ